MRLRVKIRSDQEMESVTIATTAKKLGPPQPALSISVNRDEKLVREMGIKHLKPDTCKTGYLYDSYKQAAILDDRNLTLVSSSYYNIKRRLR